MINCPKCDGFVVNRAEFPDVARCLMCGWRAYAGEGVIEDVLSKKPKVTFKGGRRKYTVMEDPFVTEWAGLFVERDEGASMLGVDAYECYEAWIAFKGEEPLRQGHFSMKLGALFDIKPFYAMIDFRGKRRYCAIWRGLRLDESEWSEPIDAEGEIAAAS